MGQESPNRLCLMTLANLGARQTESFLKVGALAFLALGCMSCFH